MFVFRFQLCVLFCLFSWMARSQSYKNLVFEGAGIRGIAYVGTLKELENRNVLSQIEKVGGTSAGAIAALCVALGYSSQDIEKIIYETKIQRFNNGKFFFVGGIVRTNHNYGWYRGHAFTRWLEEVIESKTHDTNITFQQLHDRGFRDLYITGTSLNHQKLIVFSADTYPDMKVKDAVRISMSIPLYFEPVFIDSTGQILDKKSAGNSSDVMVDGGLTGNFPIFIFDSTSTENGKPLRVANLETLGFRIDTPDQIEYDDKSYGLAPVAITRFNNYVGAFYTYVIENLNRKDLTPLDWQRTVSISSGNIGPKVRRLSQDEKNLLITNGQMATRQFLEGKPWKNSKPAGS